MSWPYESYEEVNGYRWTTWPEQVNSDHVHECHHQYPHQHAEQTPGYYEANHYALNGSLHQYHVSNLEQGVPSLGSTTDSPTSSPGAASYSALQSWCSGDPSYVTYQSGTSSPAELSSRDVWLLSPVSATPYQQTATFHQRHQSGDSDHDLATDRRLAEGLAAELPADVEFELTLETCGMRADPSHNMHSGLPRPRPQDPRWDGDEYAARWVRGEGISRAGFCGICSTWHKLKDSAYWYHMHYTHGISCATGKHFSSPRAGRRAQGAVGYDALCAGCSQWVYVGRLDRWHRPYFRHAYKCQTNNRPRISRPRSNAKHINKLSALRSLKSL